MSRPVINGEPGLLSGPLPGGTAQNAYRLISFPLNLDRKTPIATFADDLGQYNDTQWRLFEQLPDGSTMEFQDISEIVPGKAYYIISKTPIEFLDSGRGESIRTDAMFKVPLPPGWHLIGNPFNYNLPVTNLRLASANELTLHTYEGNWQPFEENEIEPFKGYLIMSSEPDTLIIDPVRFDADSSEFVPLSASKKASRPEWAIQIHTQSQEATDVSTTAAVFAQARDDYDVLDEPEPPPVGEYVTSYFAHPEWSTFFTRYSTDARPAFDHGAVWPFEVSSLVKDRVTLTFEGIEKVPEHFEVWLVDEVLQVSQNLREISTYVTAGTLAPRSFQLIVGTEAFLAEELDSSSDLPQTFELYQNFPNPFVGVTTIQYALPKASDVSLSVYNTLGQKIALLESGSREAGYHNVIWDGNNNSGVPLASGVYFIKFQADTFTETRQIVKVR